MVEVGQMKLDIKEAIFERDVNTFMAMNPRYTINYKENKIEGEIAYDGGKNPQWFASHTIEVGTDIESAGIFTFEYLSDDEMIGSNELLVKDAVDRTGADKWFEVEYQGDPVGKILIGMTYGGKGESAVEEIVVETPPADAPVAVPAP